MSNHNQGNILNELNDFSTLVRIYFVKEVTSVISEMYCSCIL